MAAFIVVMSLTFMLITNAVIHGSLDAITDTSKGKVLNALSEKLVQYSQVHDNSWKGVDQFDPRPPVLGEEQSGKVSLILLSADRKQIAVYGNTVEPIIKTFGIEQKIKSEGKVIGRLLYYDPETAVISKIKMGVSQGVGFLLFISAIFFIADALLAAYWISRRLTAPLRQLVPAIDRVKNGEHGVHVPITSKDEYGKVASAFNDMSSQLSRAEEVRRNLVADVAHELRTPLSIMRGKLDVLQQNGEPIEPENLLSIQDEMIRLTRLVDDLHQLSLAEARKLSFTFKMTDMLALLQQTIERVSARAIEKDIRMSLSSETKHTVLSVDPDRMTQVILNLLVNAIRHTPSGGSIQICLSENLDSKQQAVLQIAIQDNGSGIDPQHLPSLFDRFYRIDDSRSRTSGGMGLGLAITKEFVLIHHGMIDVKSRLEYGTTFTVCLPMDKNEQTNVRP